MKSTKLDSELFSNQNRKEKEDVALIAKEKEKKDVTPVTKDKKDVTPVAKEKKDEELVKEDKSDDGKIKLTKLGTIKLPDKKTTKKRVASSSNLDTKKKKRKRILGDSKSKTKTTKKHFHPMEYGVRGNDERKVHNQTPLYRVAERQSKADAPNAHCQVLLSPFSSHTLLKKSLWL